MTSVRERAGFAVGIVVALIVFAVLVVRCAGPRAGRAWSRWLAAASSRGSRRPASEAAEQAEGTEQRHEALQAAVANGTAGQADPRTYLKAAAAAPATAWVGEKPADPTADDWEPADRRRPVRAVRLRPDHPLRREALPGQLPEPVHRPRSSAPTAAPRSGRPGRCAPARARASSTRSSRSFPAPAPSTRSYINGFNVMFMKSDQSRRDLVGAGQDVRQRVVERQAGASPSATTVATSTSSFNGPTGGDPYVAQSHDFGATWTQTKVVDSARYIFAFDADVAADGTVYFAETSLLYGGGGNKGSYPTGPIEEHVFVSTRPWSDLAGSAGRQRPARDHLHRRRLHAGLLPRPQRDLGRRRAARWSCLYDGATTTGGNQHRSTPSARPTRVPHLERRHRRCRRAASRRSTRWSSRAGPGDVRAAWSETSGGGNVDAWNAWFRRSTDGGATWSAPVRISDADERCGLQDRRRLRARSTATTARSPSRTPARPSPSGARASYTGPGGVWINREP